MTLIDLDKFVASFITEIKKNHMVITYNIPSCIKKALEDQGLEYKGGEIVKSQRRVSAEAKEAGYDESEGEIIRKHLIDCVTRTIPEADAFKEISKEQILDWLEKQGQKSVEWKQENREELTEFENAMMHIGGSFFGENAGLDPNDTDTIKEQAELLLELAPKTEWSKEDERAFYHVLSVLEEYGEEHPSNSKFVCNWLKSIKARMGGDKV